MNQVLSSIQLLGNSGGFSVCPKLRLVEFFHTSQQAFASSLVGAGIRLNMDTGRS